LPKSKKGARVPKGRRALLFGIPYSQQPQILTFTKF
jgi:hypothetical protein